ncbi:amidase [Skermanella pratensis]|uniref:amidase n=1 Tax=Skermanella pratensis TaxID=2233999 RepID=UPI0013014C93|nr:amidase [Skermanella pratensis]
MTANPELTRLAASDLRHRIARGEVRAVEVAEAHLEAISAREEEVRAWTFLDPDHVMLQARMLDSLRSSGRPTGPLHGIPVGLKDIIDTRDMPTCNGTPLDAGRRPQTDAFTVARLREAGAIVMGKTATTELAVMNPCETRNPHDPGRTPGGSSSGSAAAVAASMVPLALGTQTNGSVIRPASFCGVVGYKPSRGTISRRGVLTQSPTLDSVGVFARSVEDAALLADVLAVYDEADPAMRPVARPQLLDGATATPPLTPVLAFVPSPVWDRAEPATREAFGELRDELNGGFDQIDLPEPFDRAHELHRTIMLADIARNFARYAERGRDQLSPLLRGMIDEGRTLLAVDYTLAQDWVEILNSALDRIFDRYDAIVTPATTGEAPVGLTTTGDPVFCTIWTYCGVPAITLPLLQGENGLPIGVQLVGRRGGDARLLRTASWLMRRFGMATPI